MSEATEPSSSGSTPPGFRGDIRQLLVDLTDMVRARRDLAELELKADVSSSKRLGLSAGLGAVLVLTAMPLLVTFLAELLQAWRPIGTESINGWVPILAGTLLLAGATLAWAGYRRFRRDFRGFRQSMAELREDVEWLQEWARGGD